MRSLTVALAVLFAGCAASLPRDEAAVPWPPGAWEPRKPVWLVRHGMHTRVAVRLEDVDRRVWPESRHFGDMTYVEAGWGDRDFYPKERPSIWDTIDPVIRPTPAALHVGGFDPPPPEFLPGAPIVRLEVSARGLTELARYIHAHYARGPSGAPIRIQAGTYPRSAFYEATGRYHALFNNSNAWAARALRAAGVPTVPARAITAGATVAQARRFGTLVGTEESGRAAGGR